MTLIQGRQFIAYDSNSVMYILEVIDHLYFKLINIISDTMTKGGITLLCTTVVLCFIQGEADNVQFLTHYSFTLRPKFWPV